MTAAVSSTPSRVILHIKFKDYRGQTFPETIELDPAIDNTLGAGLAGIAANIDGQSNAFMEECYVEKRYNITGLATAAVADQFERNISEVMGYVFEGVNPLNASKKISKSVMIPAMKEALEDIKGFPLANDALTTGTASQIALLGILNDHLAYIGTDGVVYVGGLAYVQTESHHITEEDRVDDQ